MDVQSNGGYLLIIIRRFCISWSVLSNESPQKLMGGFKWKHHFVVWSTTSKNYTKKRVARAARLFLLLLLFNQTRVRWLIKLGKFRPQPILRDKLISFQTGGLLGCFFGLLGIGPKPIGGNNAIFFFHHSVFAWLSNKIWKGNVCTQKSLISLSLLTNFFRLLFHYCLSHLFLDMFLWSS